MTRARIILEHTPSPQSRTEIEFHGGQLVIGRGDDADWRIDDPDKFVSRKHFVISEDGGVLVVTDASTGGLFVDGASKALGAGSSTPLEDGMRLRFGDFVARVDIEDAKRKTQAPAPASKSDSPFAFSFNLESDPGPKPERPKDLPEPFGRRSAGFFDDPGQKATKPVQPIDRDDPFSLDLKPAQKAQAKTDATAGQGGYFSPAPDRPQQSEPGHGPERERKAQNPEVAPKEPATAQASTPFASSDAELRAAFFRGLGLNPAHFQTADPISEMEALGRRFRTLTDGILHLLRTRAEEKQKVRVAQTIIGSANVNPLKFAVGTDDGVASLVAGGRPGYLEPDAAISEAFRDLMDHQIRTWTALQAALRQMVDKFDPEEIEREIENTGLLEAILAGGRSAKLWQLYQERYRDIARAAEERFLGEIGGDFRNAYENKGSNST